MTKDQSKELISQLEQNIIKSRKNLNDLAKLTKFLKSSEESTVVAAIHALFNAFEFLINEGRLSVIDNLAEDSPENIAINWSIGVYSQYVNTLCSLLNNKNPKICIASIRALVDIFMVRSERCMKKEKKECDNQLLTLIMKALLSLDYDEESVAIQSFLTFYANVYHDFKFYTLKCIRSILLEGDSIKEDIALNILEQIHPIPEDVNDSCMFSYDTESTNQRRLHKKALNDAVLSFLQLPFSPLMYKKVLSKLNEFLIPKMTDPKKLIDFLTETYNQGGTLSILALQSLYHLINQHNLDYPDFYDKLYALFDRNILHTPHYLSFLKLSNLFLTSTHLPAYVVAAFIKRIARLCLLATPAGITASLSIVYRLLRDHPECLVLIHRIEPIHSDLSPVQTDPYRMEEKDMKKCNAFDSSLWELAALETHICPEIASFIKNFKLQHSFSGISRIDVKSAFEKTDMQFLEISLRSELKKPAALAYLKDLKTLMTEDSVYFE